MPKLSQYLHFHLPEHPYLSREFRYPEVSFVCTMENVLKHETKLQNLPFFKIDLEENVTAVLKIVIALRRLKSSLGITAKHQPKGEK